jgi:hypothetical protein
MREPLEVAERRPAKADRDLTVVFVKADILGGTTHPGQVERPSPDRDRRLNEEGAQR